MDNLLGSIRISASGIKAQSDRIKIAAENIANEDSTGLVPGAQPYRRKTVQFKNILDREIGAELVQIAKYGRDQSEFRKKYDPSHPAADADGIVLYPNVSKITENMDVKEAQRSYEANLNVIEVCKSMINKLFDIIRS